MPSLSKNYMFTFIPVLFPYSRLEPGILREPHTTVSQQHEVFLEAQKYPSYLHPCQLNQIFFTFSQQFVDVINKFKAKDQIVSDNKMNAHAVHTAFFYREFSDVFNIMILEIQRDVASWSALAHDLNLNDLHLGWLVLPQLLLLHVSQKSFFIGL